MYKVETRMRCDTLTIALKWYFQEVYSLYGGVQWTPVFILYHICLIQPARHIICEVIRYKTIWYKLALHGWCACVSYARHSHLNRDVNYRVCPKRFFSCFYFLSLISFVASWFLLWNFVQICERVEHFLFRHRKNSVKDRVILLQDRQI